MKQMNKPGRKFLERIIKESKGRLEELREGNWEGSLRSGGFFRKKKPSSTKKSISCGNKLIGASYLPFLLFTCDFYRTEKKKLYLGAWVSLILLVKLNVP